MLELNKDIINNYNNGAKRSTNYGLNNEMTLLSDIRKSIIKTKKQVSTEISSDERKSALGGLV